MRLRYVLALAMVLGSGSNLLVACGSARCTAIAQMNMIRAAFVGDGAGQ